MRREQEAGGGEEEGRIAYKFNQLHSMWVIRVG